MKLYLVIALAAASSLSAADSGKEIFEKRCTGCHSMDSHKIGPRLAGIYGKKAASQSSFPYSDPLKKSGIVWNDQNLEKWLANPEALVPNNDMEFQVNDATERAAIIEFLKR
jgi:cytochrome c